MRRTRPSGRIDVPVLVGSDRARSWPHGALALVLSLAGCAADGVPTDTSTQAPDRRTIQPTPDLAPATAATNRAPADAPPALNDIERRVIGALDAVGITGMRAEIPFDNANIWVPLDAGGELFVSAVFTDTDHATFNVD